MNWTPGVDLYSGGESLRCRADAAALAASGEIVEFVEL